MPPARKLKMPLSHRARSFQYLPDFARFHSRSSASNVRLLTVSALGQFNARSLGYAALIVNFPIQCYLIPPYALSFATSCLRGDRAIPLNSLILLHTLERSLHRIS